MEKAEIIERLERIAGHSVHTIGEKPFIMSLDDGIAVYKAIDVIKALPVEEHTNKEWIPTSERLPEMHKEDGLLKKFTKERSDEVLVTIKDNNNGSVVVHSGCELWDGEWHGDIFRWLEASKCDYTVIAWMPLPEAYKESEANT